MRTAGAITAKSSTLNGQPSMPALGAVSDSTNGTASITAISSRMRPSVAQKALLTRRRAYFNDGFAGPDEAVTTARWATAAASTTAAAVAGSVARTDAGTTSAVKVTKMPAIISQTANSASI